MLHSPNGRNDFANRPNASWVGRYILLGIPGVVSAFLTPTSGAFPEGKRGCEGGLSLRGRAANSCARSGQT